MAQVETQDVAANLSSVPESQTDDIADKAAFEHIAHLPKMSATAGVGSGDYVAISAAAVVAIIIGAASVFTLLNIALVIIPFAGVIVAIVAIRAIENSNQTLTGKSFATIGLLLSLGFGAFAVAQWAYSLYLQHEAAVSIDEVLANFGADINNGDLNGAYGLMSERFKGRVSQATFFERLKAVQDDLKSEALNGIGYGPITGAQAGSDVAILNNDTGNVTAITYMKFKFAKGIDAEGQAVTLRKSLDHWVIDDLANLFPTQKPQGAPRS